MSDLKTAAQQALELLKELQGGCTDSDDGTVEALTVWCPEVIENLEAALEQPEQEPVARVIALENTPSVRLEWFDTKAAHNAKPGLLYNVEEVLRQSVSCGLVNNPPRRETEQEPVAWLTASRNTITWDKLYPDMHPLYTHPPRREWQGLTEEEIRKLTFHNQRTLWPRPDRSDVRATAIPFARAVEQALKERNNG
jgi:hypothetical protein